MSGMGYKMRTSIWKGLKSRAKAIRAALKKYNRLAADMQPPAPALHWKDVVNYTFVSEFDLLRSTYAHRDVLRAPWTIPRNREVAAKYFKLMSARAELPRLNREIRRLDTSIELERREYARAVQELAAGDPLLAAELRSQYRMRRLTHRVHLARIAAIRALPGYTASLDRGEPLHRGRELFEREQEYAVAAASLLESERVGRGIDSCTAQDPNDAVPLLDMDSADDVFEDEIQNTELVRLAKFLERTS
ncbi:hypothetical protein NUW54_g9651 [Trametes sanguinea]|uniref:Uncharacterized protein n=1 Tax=Trametes sanguinea TaxID=158606 RepID=A0ACC1P4V6_9APHY|nr:hypothetical protein NUW54_g9651 [Trametes sanguinea]